MSDCPIKDADIREFRRHARGLARLITRVRGYCPEANLYLACDVLNLMKGPSHDGRGERPLQDNIVEDVHIPASGGGDW